MGDANLRPCPICDGSGVGGCEDDIDCLSTKLAHLHARLAESREILGIAERCDLRNSAYWMARVRAWLDAQDASPSGEYHDRITTRPWKVQGRGIVAMGDDDWIVQIGPGGCDADLTEIVAAHNILPSLLDRLEKARESVRGRDELLDATQREIATLRARHIER